MVETAETAADDPGETPRATFEDLAAGPERAASAGAVGPVRAAGPGGTPPVLLTEDAFERLSAHPPRAFPVSELTGRDMERMRAQPIPEEAAEFDHEGDFLGRG